MDRRTFLKYAAVSGLAAGSALAGYEFDRWQSSSLAPSVYTVTKTQTLTQTMMETVRLAWVHGRLFFDYNGNGVQDGEEPAVTGATVQLKDDSGRTIAEAVTDSAGDYKLEDMKTRSYRLNVEADRKFRYMCRSTEEFTAVSEGYDVVLDRNQRADIGLMEGFLTLPLDTEDYLLWSYVDLDHKIGTVRNFSGDRKEAVDNPSSTHARPGTSDQHQGVDYYVPRGRNLLAMASGVVFQSEGGGSYARYVRIVHRAGDEMFITEYAHNSMNLVEIGDVVKRGQVIALSGNSPETKNMKPHLHTSLWQIPEAYQSDILRYVFEILPKAVIPPMDHGISHFSLTYVRVIFDRSVLSADTE